MGMDAALEFLPAPGVGFANDSILALAKAWIQRALASAAQGNSVYYRKILTDLREAQAGDAASVSSLQLRVRALSQSVYFIDENYHRALLDHLLGMSLWTFGGDVASALLAFVVNLVSSNAACVGQCMDMLVRNFLPPSCGLASFLDTYNKTALITGVLSMEQLRSEESAHLARKEDVLTRLHAAIKQIASLVPTTPLRMQPIVIKRTPHRSSAKVWNLLYLENMLRLEGSGGRYLSNQMLPAIVDHLTQIDVEIRWEDILNDDESGRVYMFHMDVEEESEDWERKANEPADETGEAVGPGMEGKNLQGLLKTSSSQNKVATLDEMADKMDAMMDMTFTHLHTSVKRGQSLQVFYTLMKSFQSTILQTHKLKFTQFLIFYLCSLEPTACGSRFAALLCEMFSCRARAPISRISAAAYLASYLARASFLSSHVICSSLKRMVGWCIVYGDADDVNCTPDGMLHGVFFSVCQAIMYTLCFRFKMLVEDAEGKRVLRGLPLQQLVDHPLNPMEVCLPSVVDEFLRKASFLQLVDQKAWLTSKERFGRTYSAPIVGDIRLDMFFPFDPYLLRLSDRFIRPNFNFWYVVEPLGGHDVSDLEDDFNDAGSDVSSDTESLPYQDAFPSSPREQLEVENHSSTGEHLAEENRIEDDRVVDDKESDLKKSVTQNTEKMGAALRLNIKFVANSPATSVAATFRSSFDAMSITPPQSHRMPAKFPGQEAAKAPIPSVPSFHM